MECKYYSVEKTKTELPSNDIIGGKSTKHGYHYCKLYRIICDSCNGVVEKCFHTEKAIEAKRILNKGTNRDWLNSLTNEELIDFIKSEYFSNMLKNYSTNVLTKWLEQKESLCFKELQSEKKQENI